MTGYQSKKVMAQDKLAQPEQEPHSWYSKQVDEWMTNKTRKEHERLNSYTHKVGKFDLALYTTPPQRTWVEPTGNEWFEWWRVSKVADETEAEIDFADFLIIAQAVVAKLKEKNNA